MSEVNWQDPPAITRGRHSHVWIDRLSPLMERPGIWALIGEFGASVVTDLRNGRYPLPPGGWEFTARRNGRRTARADLYARYLGPEQ